MKALNLSLMTFLLLISAQGAEAQQNMYSGSPDATGSLPLVITSAEQSPSLESIAKAYHDSADARFRSRQNTLDEKGVSKSQTPDGAARLHAPLPRSLNLAPPLENKVRDLNEASPSPADARSLSLPKR